MIEISRDDIITCINELCTKNGFKVKYDSDPMEIVFSKVTSVLGEITITAYLEDDKYSLSVGADNSDYSSLSDYMSSRDEVEEWFNTDYRECIKSLYNSRIS